MEALALVLLVPMTLATALWVERRLGYKLERSIWWYEGLSRSQLVPREPMTRMGVAWQAGVGSARMASALLIIWISLYVLRLPLGMLALATTTGAMLGWEVCRFLILRKAVGTIAGKRELAPGFLDGKQYLVWSSAARVTGITLASIVGFRLLVMG